MSDAHRENLTRAKRTPDFEERRIEGLKAWLNSPEGRASRSASSKKMWITRRRKGIAGDIWTQERREARAEEMRKQNKNPAFAFRRDKAATKTLKSPRVQIKRLLAIREWHDRQRGFKVPARLWSEYKKLRDKGRLSARDAGRVLGLIP